jgi:hypothetical protein
MNYLGPGQKKLRKPGILKRTDEVYVNSFSMFGIVVIQRLDDLLAE